MKIIKQELEFEECLKQRLGFICEFSKVTPTLYANIGTFRAFKQKSQTLEVLKILDCEKRDKNN